MRRNFTVRDADDLGMNPLDAAIARALLPYRALGPAWLDWAAGVLREQVEEWLAGRAALLRGGIIGAGDSSEPGEDQ